MDTLDSCNPTRIARHGSLMCKSGMIRYWHGFWNTHFWVKLLKQASRLFKCTVASSSWFSLLLDVGSNYKSTRKIFRWLIQRRKLSRTPGVCIHLVTKPLVERNHTANGVTFFSFIGHIFTTSASKTSRSSRLSPAFTIWNIWYTRRMPPVVTPFHVSSYSWHKINPVQSNIGGNDEGYARKNNEEWNLGDHQIIARTLFGKTRELLKVVSFHRPAKTE